MKSKIQFIVRILLSAALLYWVWIDVHSWALLCILFLAVVANEGNMVVNQRQNILIQDLVKLVTSRGYRKGVKIIEVVKK